MTKIILKGYMLIPDTDLDAVKKELPNHIQLTRQEEGCLVFNVFLDAKNPDRFNVYEDFLIAPHLNLIRRGCVAPGGEKLQETLQGTTRSIAVTECFCS